MRGGLEGARVPNPAQDHSRFEVDDSFGSGEFEVALEEGLERSLPVCSNSSGESAPQYRSSAILATTPS